jgi:hypothetical protein
MSEYTHLFERAAARYPEPDLSTEGLLLRGDRKRRNQRLAAGVLGIAVFAFAAVGLVRLLASEGPTPAVDPDTPFLGTWVSTSDADGGTRTMTVRASEDAGLEIVVRDDVATVCAGTPSTMTATGTIDPTGALVLPAPEYTCDDGREPETFSDPPIEEQLRNMTFVFDAQTETLSDGAGGVWLREGAEVPDPLAALRPIWPQSSRQAVREAQELADAGDPAYTWQLDPALMSGWAQTTDDTVIVARFLREKLGWDGFRLVDPAADPDVGAIYDSGYVRCAAGATNPLYPNDPRGGGCAPTMDEGRYERVSIDIAQLVRQDDSGIWVVTRWEIVEPFAQVGPLTEAETAALLDRFLQARVDGNGAQEYLGVPESDVPFLYASSSGSPYVRSEFEVVEGPVWPEGSMRFTVRLFAEDGETVEQQLSLDRPGGGLLYSSEAEGPDGPIPGTTVDGEGAPVSYRLLDDEVSLQAAWPWHGSSADPGTWILGRDDLEANMKLLVDPRPIGRGCTEGSPVADADALARSIRSDPDLKATRPVAVTVGGVEALRMDVSPAAGASSCEHPIDSPLALSGAELAPGYGMRLYLLDLPGGPARILAIAIVAPTANVDRAVEEAAPIVDSIELHASPSEP